MPDTNQKDDTYSETETVARSEAELRRTFAAPHAPHKASKVGRRESQSK